VAELVEQVGRSFRSAALVPHEFSGRQRQRIAIARAQSQLHVLDEPVSALDISILAQINVSSPSPTLRARWK
jgi:ABC-type oligopeptide transport system ATPase subunit